jgi:hypothetical protein
VTALRVGHDDRQRVVDVLAEAYAAGRLDLGEYEERVTSAYAARTDVELAALTADLPLPPARPRPSAGPYPALPDVAPRAAPHRAGAAVLPWAAVSALCLAIWAVTCVAGGQWLHPWWVWVAGPWGLALLAGGRGCPLRGGRPPFRAR